MNAFQLDLPKFELLEEVGHGGMATVYRARDKRLDREVAVKVIHRHLRENPEVARRFASEALAVAKLKHPNIVEVYDVSADDELERYLVVELVRGMTLRKLLVDHGALPPELAASIAVEVLRALAVAHRHGVIHRDIKPENVLVRLGCDEDVPRSSKEAPVRIKLTDFGIAKLLDAQGVTHTGQVLGSPAHMAPEQIEGGDVDARADVFGVGVLLYEMLTGVLPFEGKNPAQVLRRVLEGSFTPPDRVLATIGVTYSRIVEKALARDPGDRFATATEFADELERELSRLGVENPRKEVHAYCEDTTLYEANFSTDIVTKLTELGHKLRKEGNVVLSAACFNRALAYRPDDTMLLAAVSGLRKRGQIRKMLSLGALAVAGLSVIVFSALLGRWYMARSIPPRVEPPPAPKAETPRAATSVAAVAESPSPKEIEPKETKVRRNPGGRTVTITQQAPTSNVTRQVRTPVIGPQNARVRIDGKLYPWFNAHELSLGLHSFEFLPPNEECCEVPPSAQVQITDGEGPQIVRGVIKFRPALLELTGQRGGRASCGMAGALEVGSTRTVPMNQAEMRLSCTVFAPPTSTEPPKTVQVLLRPGQKIPLVGF